MILTHLPPLFEARMRSFLVVAPTLMTPSTRPGVYLQALLLLFPDAVATNTPAWTSCFTASSINVSAVAPPSARTTENDDAVSLIRSSITYSIDDTTSNSVPELFSSSVFTQMMRHFLHTPCEVPAAIPATCVP